MHRFQKIKSFALALVLACSFLSVPAAADDAPFLDNSHWSEVSSLDLTQMYGRGDSFVAMFFRHTCFNSNLRKTMLSDWMDAYDLQVYGVDNDQDYLPPWVQDALDFTKPVSLPIICIVNGGASGTVHAFTASDSMRSIQKCLQESLGIYDESAVDFSGLDLATYSSYSTRPSKVAQYAAYLLAPSATSTKIRQEAESITQNAASDLEKLKAIYDWVTTNIYYNYGMLNGTFPRAVKAEDTYLSKSSVCAGYANLTKALCNAVGIPCRVVTGYATGVETESTVNDVWSLYKAYLADRDLGEFSSQVSPYVNHAWNEAYVEGRWVILDTTWGSNNEYHPYQGGVGMIEAPPTDDYFDPDLVWFSESHLFWTGASDLTAIHDRGQISVSGTLDASDVAASSRAFLASYDSSGKLLECTAADINGVNFSQILTNSSNATTVKLYLLSGQSTPAAPVYLGNIS